MESTALAPLSEPALPPCSAGDVLRVDPSVAAVLPSSSLAADTKRDGQKNVIIYVCNYIYVIFKLASIL